MRVHAPRRGLPVLTYYLHTTPHEFSTPDGRAMDWGHWLRQAKRPWSIVARVLAWNPCNNIGHLYDCPALPAGEWSWLYTVKTVFKNDRHEFIAKRVLPEVYSDDKSDEEIIHDGVLNMWAREEEAMAQHRAERKRNRKRL